MLSLNESRLELGFKCLKMINEKICIEHYIRLVCGRQETRVSLSHRLNATEELCLENSIQNSNRPENFFKTINYSGCEQRAVH